MSGTSMDGIDVALLRTNGVESVEHLDHITVPYSHDFQILLKACEYAFAHAEGQSDRVDAILLEDAMHYLKHILQFSQKQISFLLKKWQALQIQYHASLLQALTYHSTELHHHALCILLKKQALTSSEIDLIGYHGQTMYHAPHKKQTVQLGFAHMLATLSQINVIADFRKHDVQQGGQGAPLAPIYHQALCANAKKLPAAFINCGGISNLTLILGLEAENLIGYDAGPGNVLLDRFIKIRTQGKMQMDKDGHYARTGRIDPVLLDLLKAGSCKQTLQNYYTLPPPKSLDSKDFELLAEFSGKSIEDGAATLASFTAKCIVDSLDLISPLPHIPYWILAGGGFEHPVIYSEFKRYLTARYGAQVQVMKACELGWKPNAIEAELMAYLAVRTFKGLPISFPKTTAAPYPLIGGTLYEK